jgi:hypothetical protein
MPLQLYESAESKKERADQAKKAGDAPPSE